MQPLKCSLSLALALGMCHMCIAMPGRYTRAADGAEDASLVSLQFDNNENDLNPINSEVSANDELDRNKRKLPGATFEAKNAVLGFVFGNQRKRTKRATKTYPDGIPEFDRENVALDFPDELFNQSFSTFTRISQTFSRLIMNTARRYSRFVLFFKPIFGDALVVKGSEDPTTTTTTTTPKPKTTTSNPSDNEV